MFIGRISTFLPIPTSEPPKVREQMAWLPPLLLHYYITLRCNCRCRVCDIWQSHGQDASLGDVRNNLREASRMGVRFVDLTGGEPLLHSDLPEMLKCARDLNLRTSITTNALLYPERHSELAGLVDFLHFSLDAATAALHNRLRNMNVFDAVIHSIDIARAAGEKPDILFTATAENLDQLPYLTDFCSRTGLMLIVNPVFSNRTKNDLNHQQLKYIESFQNIPFVYVNRAFHTLRQNGGNQTEKPRCRAADAAIVLSPENRLILPCFHFQQAQYPIIAGLAAVRKAHLAEHRQQQGRWKECQGCNLNCYFDPSFMYQLDRLFLQSTAAKLKYAFTKYVHHSMITKLKGFDPRPAAEIMRDVLSAAPQPSLQ